MRVGICALIKGLSNNYQERGKAEKRASHVHKGILRGAPLPTRASYKL